MANERAFLGSPDNPKTAAVVCYITIAGWLIAYFALYKNTKTSLAAYHLRQTLLLYIVLLIVNGLGYWATPTLIIVLNVLWFLLWLWGMITAVYEREQPIPLIGRLAQTLFRRL